MSPGREAGAELRPSDSVGPDQRNRPSPETDPRARNNPTRLQKVRQCGEGRLVDQRWRNRWTATGHSGDAASAQKVNSRWGAELRLKSVKRGETSRDLGVGKGCSDTTPKSSPTETKAPGELDFVRVNLWSWTGVTSRERRVTAWTGFVTVTLVSGTTGSGGRTGNSQNAVRAQPKFLKWTKM